MNKQQVMETLKSKGFEVEEMEDGVIAKLNRNMDTNEIVIALGNQGVNFDVVKVAHNAIGVIVPDELTPDDYGYWKDEE